jgi:tetratricopeptide (TPR) repeat protein
MLGPAAGPLVMRDRILLLLVCLAAVVAGADRCASAPPPVGSDRFPLDPREGLPGPFDEAIGRGWQALLAGDTSAAENAFAGVHGGTSERTAEIGTIEAFVESGRGADALGRCAEALTAGEPTVPLLVACGEARAQVSQPVGAFELYERAAVRAPDRPWVAARMGQLREAAVRELLQAAEESAAEGQREDARTRLVRALALGPRSSWILARAAEVECAAGEKERALDDYREALALGGLDVASEERAGDLALEVGDDAMAVSIFESLAARDPRFHGRAAEARLSFRIANWPDAERQAARARRLTRGGAAVLAWWMFPEVREARVKAGVVASDVLARKDSRAVMRAASLGFLDVDPGTHRARPDAPLLRVAAARFLLRLASALPGAESGLDCLREPGDPPRSGTDAIRVAVRCGLLSESVGLAVGGAEFTRGLDRLRSLVPAGEAAYRD